MTKLAPAAPVAPWLGGKKALHQKIIARIDHIPHDTYVEPFVGMGGVFLRRQWRPKCEVENDLSSEITNLFRILQRHYPQFMEVMRFQITSRAEFDRLRACDPATLTDLERAARFLYLQRLAFGGQVGGVFGVSPSHAPRFSLSRLEPILDAAHARLDRVIFENLPWADVVRRWDGPSTLFYLDPPYWGGESDYGKGMFSRDDFSKIARAMREIRGKFIMSINDTPEIRAIFEGFDMEEVSLSYTVARAGANKARELILSNHIPRGRASCSPSRNSRKDKCLNSSDIMQSADGLASANRHGAVFLLWCAAFAWMAAKEAAGLPMDGTQSILSLAFPMVIANLALAHGMEWVSTQTNFGAGRGERQ